MLASYVVHNIFIISPCKVPEYPVLQIVAVKGWRANHLKKFMLDETLANIQRRGLAKGFDLLEITSDEGTVQFSLRKIREMTLVKE